MKRNRLARVGVLAALAALALPASASEVVYVIHISVDGLHSDLLESLLANDAAGRYANFQRLVDEGAGTFNARTDYTHTVTIPNHTTMLSGRPVLQPSGQANTVHHGYTSNSDPAPTYTLHNRGNPNVGYVASAFDVVHDNGLSTGLYVSKSKFVIYEQSYNAATGAADTTGADDGKDKIDRYVNLSGGFPAHAASMHAVFIQELSTTPHHYSFVHYRDPDSAGHAFGWGSTAWNNAVEAVDGYLEDIFNVVESSGELQNRTVVIVSSDHGGSGTGHSNAATLAHYRIPFFVWGATIRTGTDLYALNAARRTDPGPGRPDYNANPPPIRNGDSGNLALHLLGLNPVPGSTINAGQDLVAREPVAVNKRSMGRLKQLYR